MDVKEKHRQSTNAVGALHENLRLTTLVVGLGDTGVSCARYLKARGEQLVLADSRESPPGLELAAREFPEVPVHLGRFDKSLFERVGRVVLSPGVAMAETAVETALQAGVPVCGDIELFARATRVPTVAITGSNGKSTVTTLLADMARRAGLRVQSGGNLGPPALDLLVDESCELFVLEVSSFQLETTSTLAPVASTVLNISPDHMDRYPNLASYSAAKQRVYRGNGVMVVNRDDPEVAAMINPQRRVVGFTLGVPASDDFGVDDGWLCHGGQALMQVTELGVAGTHNVANALAALALGDAIGLVSDVMVESLSSFEGLAHRCELVAEHQGVRWLNDSKATNVGATVAAVRGLADPAQLVLIAGGEGKGAHFTPLREAVRDLRAVILIGRDASLIEREIEGVCPVYRACSLRDAVVKAGSLAAHGDCVLLSPACASFDMFDNYEARGLAFIELVRERYS